LERISWLLEQRSVFVKKTQRGSMALEQSHRAPLGLFYKDRATRFSPLQWSKQRKGKSKQKIPDFAFRRKRKGFAVGTKQRESLQKPQLRPLSLLARKKGQGAS
jgi:hypothetical protein